MDKEKIMKIQVLEQETNKLNSRLELIEQNIKGIEEILECIIEIEKNNNKEMFVNIGKKIYLPVTLKEKIFYVDIGKENLVKMGAFETKELVKNQLKKLVLAKEEVMKGLESMQPEAEKLIKEIEGDNEKKDKTS
jgi:prefoldin alpha subunit